MPYLKEWEEFGENASNNYCICSESITYITFDIILKYRLEKWFFNYKTSIGMT